MESRTEGPKGLIDRLVFRVLLAELLGPRSVLWSAGYFRPRIMPTYLLTRIFVDFPWQLDI